ncbi:MAG: 50S ribosomal protein L21, partial [bacterium]|nr:50S ribosomal protein L21 [bacterium]
MKYAVIKFSGRQYLISEGEEIVADKQNLIKPDSSFNIPEILLFIDGDDIRVGQPYVEDVAVTAKITSDFKGEKIKVRKFKSKARYRKTIGFRPKLCKVKIEKISPAGKEKVKESLP